MICLLPHCAFLSETSRMIAIYEALRRSGAEVCVATHGGLHEGFLRDAGIPYQVLEPRMTAQRCSQFLTDVTLLNPRRPWYSDDELRAMVASEVAFFREHGVRVAVTGFTLTALLSTRVVGIPLAGSYAGSFVPPAVEQGIVPAPSAPQPPPFQWLPRPLLRRVNNWLMPRMQMFSRDFDRMARELGIAGLPSFLALFAPDWTLVTEVPEVLGIPRDELESWTPRRPQSYRPGPRLRYVGPIYAKLNRPIPPRVEAFLRNEPDRPIIYVAITSTPSTLVRGVVEALRPTGARLLVASTVHTIEGLEHPDVLVEDFLPSHLVMPQVSLTVIAGGQGSVQTAMASGTPMIGIPLQPEQDLNVYLIEQQGAGKLVPRHLAATPHMTAVARVALEDPTLRANARRIQEIYARVDGPAEAARTIMEICEARPH